jgi:hypothetical protein
MTAGWQYVHGQLLARLAAMRRSLVTDSLSASNVST